MMSLRRNRQHRMADRPPIIHRKLLLGLMLGCGLLFCFLYNRKLSAQEEWKNTNIWLKENHLDKWDATLQKHGFSSLEEFGKLLCQTDMKEYPRFSRLPSVVQTALEDTQDRLAFMEMLQANKLGHLYKELEKHGYGSFSQLQHITEENMQQLTVSDSSLRDYVRLKSVVKDIHTLKTTHIQQLYALLGDTRSDVIIMIKLVFFTIVALIGSFLYNKSSDLLHAFRKLQETHREQNFYHIFSGQPISLDNTHITWGWAGSETVGRTFSFDISFFRINRNPYPLDNIEKLLVEITCNQKTTDASIEKLKHRENSVNVTFTVHEAGKYSIAIMYEGRHIRGSPFYHDFLPGLIKPQNTVVVGQYQFSNATVGIPHQMYIEPRDEYNNKCLATDFHTSDVHINVKETKSQYTLNLRPRLLFDKSSQRIVANFKINEEGAYLVCIKYQDIILKNGESTLLVLSEKQIAQKTKCINKKGTDTYFEAILLADDKHKKVYCYISPKQLVVKEYFMKIFPKRVHTFRVNPYTSFNFFGCHNQYKKDMMSISDGCQGPVFLVTKDCLLLAAVYTAYVNSHILAGAETFTDKSKFFYAQLREHHRKRHHSKLRFTINRCKLLESSFKATKDFTTSDWCKYFEITFANEEGLDWGGLRREWFETLCTELFEKSGLFIKLSDDSQSLYHPNPHRSSDMKLKYYEFAGRIVAKCLYESALSSSYRQLVKARFSRSFLAQLLGLRVNYKYFEQDDPELYKTKIKFILENSVEDMDMTFTEEVYVHNKLYKVANLIDNGNKVKVTDGNKMKYLDALAQYRLVSGVKDEVNAFQRGLNDIAPDSLLSMFDEYELELLMCGTGDYSVADLKKHHVIAGGNLGFSQAMQRFWTIISGFKSDDMARLLQFTTGCSQLPPGGFGDLTPLITFSPVPSFGKLPTAHTCFNQLCLPEYNSIEEMHHALLTAIREGNQGFLLV